MLVNYFKLAVRLLIRNPFLSSIIILGLSIGFASFFVLWQYTSSELNSDRFYKDYQQIVRVAFKWQLRDDFGNVETNTIAGFSPGFCEVLMQESNDFETYTRIYDQPIFDKTFHPDHGTDIYLSHLTPSGERIAFKETRLAYGDPNAFEFFGLPLLEGSPHTVLKEPNSIVLSETMAKKYFGRKDVVGSLINVNDSIALKVTGVFADLPQNTHLAFDALMSTERIKVRFNQLPERTEGARLYFRAKDNIDQRRLSSVVDAVAKKYWAPLLSKFDLNPSDLDFFVQPVADISFSKFSGDTHETRSKSFLKVLRAVSIVILVIGWINYLNMVNYSNSKRSKEIGVRRTSGAKNIDFIGQFMVESMLANAIAILVAFTFLQIIKVPLQNLLQFKLSSTLGMTGGALVVIGTVAVVGIILTGIYPALATMRRNTRGILATSRHDLVVGKWLTIFQFSAAIVLIVTVFTIYFQMEHILKKDLGIKRDEVIVMDLPENPASYPPVRLNSFLERLATIQGVSNYAVSSSTPGDLNRNGIGLQRTAASKFFGVGTDGGVDERFLSFYNIKILAGRNFRNDDPSNVHSLIVSKNVLERLGLGAPEEAIGQTLLVEAKEWTHQMVPTTIIGVIDDYFRIPLLAGLNVPWSNEVGVALTYHNYVDAENTPRKVSMIINDENFTSAIKELEKLYNETFDRGLFNWYFLNDHLNKHYENEKAARSQLILSASLAIGIACLGLLGMITNKAVEKTKEIGIRKVLGARVYQISRVLLNNTIRQIGIATIVGLPLAYYITQQYLAKFSERITLQWWHFGLPVVILVSIMFLVVSSVLWKAATNNPVEALKHE